jgi:hypothetical protein
MKGLRLFRDCSALVLLTWTAGCGSPYLRPTLFVVEAADAEMPVMVSRTRSHAKGRPLHVASATRDDYSRSSETLGTFNGVVVSVDTSTAEHTWSDAAPWPQLKGHLLPDDSWLQITGMKYTAVDESNLGFSSVRRSLDVDAVAR